MGTHRRTSRSSAVGLSGAAATNAALALLGGGTLATGGAGAAVLAGIAFAPIAVLAVGGIAIARRLNRKQRRELSERLDQAEAELAASAPVAIATLKFERLLLTRDAVERTDLAELAEEVLRTARETIQEHI